MYFILSKVLLFIITPVYWILVLLLIAAFTKRKKLRRWTSVSGLVILLVFSNSWLFNFAERSWDSDTVELPANAKYSCVIVLGGFVSTRDGKEGFLNDAADRFDQGVNLYKTGKASHILITGGNSSLNPNAFSEGEWCRKQLQKLNIPDSAILIEGNARNTIENAKLSSPILKQSGLKPPYLLVTSASHMRRARMIFEKNGLQVQPFACDVRTAKISWPVWTDIFPEPYVVLAWGGFFKEMVGYMVNRFMN